MDKHQDTLSNVQHPPPVLLIANDSCSGATAAEILALKKIPNYKKDILAWKIKSIFLPGSSIQILSLAKTNMQCSKRMEKKDGMRSWDDQEMRNPMNEIAFCFYFNIH